MFAIIIQSSNKQFSNSLSKSPIIPFFHICPQSQEYFIIYYIILLMNMLHPEQSFTQAIIRNEQSVLSALKIFVDMLGNLSSLSDIIYTNESSYPIQIYKTFRMLYENAQSLSNILENYQSQNQQFLQLKNELIAQQIQCMERIINREQSVDDRSYKKFGKAHNRQMNQKGQEDNQANLNLQREIQTLKAVLQRNNLQFQEEIKKYNNHLYELKDNLQRYELEVQRIPELQVVIEELENKIVVLREEKERDTLMIENMARKIRFFEKEKGGRDAFLSPRAIDSQSRLLSPNSNKLAFPRPQIPQIQHYKRYP